MYKKIMVSVVFVALLVAMVYAEAATNSLTQGNVPKFTLSKTQDCVEVGNTNDASGDKNVAGVTSFGIKEGFKGFVGSVTIKRVADYKLSDSKIVEFSCDSDKKVVKTEQTCNNGVELIRINVGTEAFVSAKCIVVSSTDPGNGGTGETTPTCGDSDSTSTLPVEVAGYVKVGSTLYPDACDGNNLKEISCSEGKPIASNVVCDQASPCTTQSLGISDVTLSGGKCAAQKLTCNKAEKTTTKVDESGKVETKIDKCKNKNTLTVSKCSDTETGTKVITSVDVNCPLGCNDGACLTNVLCQDSDTGKELGVKGSIKIKGSEVVSDFCSDAKHLVELSCSKKTSDGWTAIKESAITERIHVKTYTCKYGCSNGQCTPAPSQSQDSVTPEANLETPAGAA